MNLIFKKGSVTNDQEKPRLILLRENTDTWTNL